MECYRGRVQAIDGARWIDLGRVPYRAALGLQERVASERSLGLRPDTLLLLEHPPTVTLGRRALDSALIGGRSELERRGIVVERVGRGGGATYHGPGQLVGYPIVELDGRGRRVRRFVEGLENALVAAVASFGVAARRSELGPGVWVRGEKIASIGIEVRRGVTRHGFALNVAMDLGPFAAIVACGTPGLRFTDLRRASGAPVTVAAAAAAVLRAWRERFGEISEEGTNELRRAD